jgi:hypothetical protein
MVSGLEEQKFDAIKFVMAENLPTDLWNRSQKKVGLVVVATKVNSVPRDTVFAVEGDPVSFIRNMSKKEGITPEKVDELITKLRNDDIPKKEEVSGV